MHNVAALPLLTTKEAADHLKLSQFTLRKLRMTAGGPKFVKFGKNNGPVRYRREDLNDYVEASLMRSTSE